MLRNAFNSGRPCLLCAFRLRGYPASAARGFSTGTTLGRQQSKSNLSFRKGRHGKHSGKGRNEPKLTKFARAAINPQEFVRIISHHLYKMQNLSKTEDFRIGTGLDHDKMEEQMAGFFNMMEGYIDSWRGPSTEWQTPNLRENLWQAWLENEDAGVDAQLQFTLQGHLANECFSPTDILNQAKLADLRYPYEWYPDVRMLQRQIHLHIGPTNSGKTYQALQRLEQAKSGVYAGPLRLLAYEVYSRMNAKGKPCNLITGDERLVVEGDETAMSSCTVEMVPMNTTVEVAIVDEIQMIGDNERGWAWTQAVLGLKAKELHLCGEERALPLIRELAAAMGDRLEVHRYERLSPLKTMSTSLNGNLKDLQKGDCVVAFSRALIHELKNEIVRKTGKKVAVVYGSLPPETRAEQARLFNDPNNDYDILVASNAIGMGLNLSIKRIIFESVAKYNGSELARLPISDIKQIAGRAGRYRTANDDAKERQLQTADGVDSADTVADVGLPPEQNLASTPKTLGLVTTLERMDLPILQRSMEGKAESITSAGIFPTDNMLLRFANYFPPKTPLSYIMLRMQEVSRMHSRFHLCNLRDKLAIADIIQVVTDLTTMDRLTFCAAPASYKKRDKAGARILLAFARCVAKQGGGALLDIPELPLELLDSKEAPTIQSLQLLESLHKALVLYLWLSYRFSGVFVSQPLALHAKGLVEKKISEALAVLAAYSSIRENLKKKREKVILQEGLKEVGEPITATSGPSDAAKESSDETGTSVPTQEQHDDRLVEFALEDEAIAESPKERPTLPYPAHEARPMALASGI